jgi:putative SOS response-associated peptidase YedK
MCGRFTISTRKERIEDAFDGAAVDHWLPPRYNVAPTQDIPVILNDGANRVTLARWGLIPSWAKDASIGNRLINARAETLHEKPAFKQSFKSRRCVVIADGFYEWRTVPGSRIKVPLFIRLKSGDPFGFAGLWDRWKDPEDHERLTCTIITTSPNDLVRGIHDRMPAILSTEARRTWLTPGPVPSEALQACLAPYPASEMTAHEVSTRVNKPGIDSPDLIEPAPTQGTLL